jgi:hypothetical protein
MHAALPGRPVTCMWMHIGKRRTCILQGSSCVERRLQLSAGVPERRNHPGQAPDVSIIQSKTLTVAPMGSLASAAPGAAGGLRQDPHDGRLPADVQYRDPLVSRCASGHRVTHQQAQAAGMPLQEPQSAPGSMWVLAQQPRHLCLARVQGCAVCLLPSLPPPPCPTCPVLLAHKSGPPMPQQ